MRASWTRPGDWSDAGARAARLRAGVGLAAVALGIVLGRGTPWAVVGLWFALALGASAVAAMGHGRVCRAALVGAAVLLAAGWTQARVHTVARTSVETLLPGYVGGVTRPVLVRLEGRVLSSVVMQGAPATPLDPIPVGEPLGWIDVRVDRARTEAGPVAASGVVRVSAPGLRDEDVEPGGRVLVTGWATRSGPALNPGRWNLWARDRQRALAARVRVASPALIEPLDEGLAARACAAPTRWRGLLRRRAAAALGDTGSDADALMGALLLGRRDPGIGEVHTRFRLLGVSHLLAVSGFHLAVLAGLALWLVRLTGERGRLESALVGAATLVYLIVLPTRTPIARSGIMVVGVLAGEAAGRRPDRLATLAWIAVGLLVWRPMDLWSIGYQLSVGVTALLVWLGCTRHPWVFGTRVHGARGFDAGRFGRVWGPLFGTLRGTLVTCVLCWLVAAPTILAHTGVLSPVAPIASAVLLPFVLLDLAIGFVCVVAGSVAPGLAGVSSDVLGVLGGVTLWVAGWLERVPGATFVLPSVSWVWAAGATLWVVWFVGRARLRDARGWAAGALLVAWLVGEVVVGPRLVPVVVLRVDTLAVGDGTCHLVRSGDAAVLWDAGSLTRGWAEWNTEDALRARGAGAVGSAVVSHPNLDHYNALPALAHAAGLRRVYVTDAMLERLDRRSESYWLGLLEHEGVEIGRVGAGDVLRIGHARITLLAGGADADLGANDRSLVARIEVETDGGVRRVLMTGDIQAAAMARLAERGVDVRADVLELPHHGSVHAAALDFVATVDPAVVLQSTGPSRALDPRWDSVRAGRVWWTTAVDGAAWVEFRRDGSVVTGATLDAGDRDFD